MSFGEKVRVSEEPIYIEECIYEHGRLSTYKKGNIIYKLHWSPEGEILEIVSYNSAGVELESFSLKRYNAYWTTYAQLEGGKNGLHIISLRDVLLMEKRKTSDKLVLSGYGVSALRFDGSYSLQYRRIESVFGKIRGQIAKYMDRIIIKMSIKILSLLTISLL